MRNHLELVRELLEKLRVSASPTPRHRPAGLNPDYADSMPQGVTLGADKFIVECGPTLITEPLAETINFFIGIADKTCKFSIIMFFALVVDY